MQFPLQLLSPICDFKHLPNVGRFIDIYFITSESYQISVILITHFSWYITFAPQTLISNWNCKEQRKEGDRRTEHVVRARQGIYCSSYKRYYVDGIFCLKPNSQKSMQSWCLCTEGYGNRTRSLRKQAGRNDTNKRDMTARVKSTRVKIHSCVHTAP